VGLLEGSASYRAFRFEAPTDLRTQLFERRFREIKTDEEVSVGAVSLTSPLDPPDASCDVAGRYVAVAVRVDSWRVDGPLFKGLVKKAESERLAKTGRERLTRDEKQAVKDEVRIRIRYPRMAVVDVLFDLGLNIARVFGNNEHVLDFLGEQATPLREFGDMDTRTNWQERTCKEGGSRENDDFLPWLWMSCELGDHDELGHSAGVVGKMTFASTVNDSKCSLSGFEAGSFDEAKAALLSGREPAAIAIMLLDGDAKTRVTISRHLGLAGMRIPATIKSKDDDVEARLLDRINLIERCEERVEELYGKFIDQRRDASVWQEKLDQFSEWLGV
jgi:hypothetical protein